MLAGMVILISMNACREEFSPDFADVEIRNNPPKVSKPIEDVLLTQGFGTYELNLNQYIFDVEGDLIKYTATNSDNAVVKITLNGSILKITEVGAGSSTVKVTATDGIEGNVTSTEFKVIVNAKGLTWFPMFDFQDITVLLGLNQNGAPFSYEGFDGASITVRCGVLDFAKNQIF